MKLGVLGSAFNCHDLLPRTLEPWIKAREKYDLKIAVSSIQFDSFQDCDNSKTLEILGKSNLDFYTATGHIKLSEAEARNQSLNELLKMGCSQIAIWDADELYSDKDIDGLFKFVSDEPFTAWFEIQFRNLTFSEQTYTRNFSPPRVFKVNYNGYKLKRFYYDNDVMYVDKDGREKSYKELVSQKIPSKFCWPLHYSWLDNETSKMKVEYQKKRWGNDGCMFDWIDDHLAWNEAFFKKTGISKPELFRL